MNDLFSSKSLWMQKATHFSNAKTEFWHLLFAKNEPLLASKELWMKEGH
jgi:hypothetical protein